MGDKQTGLQFNRSEFFVAERNDGVLDRDAIELKLDQLNELMDVVAQREKQLINFRDRLELPPVEVSVQMPVEVVEKEAVERNENGRKVRKDKGKKRVEKFKGHYRTKRNGEKVWVPPGTRKAKGRTTETPILHQASKLEMKWDKQDEDPEETKEFIQSIAGIEEVKEENTKPVRKYRKDRKKGYKLKGHYRTNKDGVRVYVGKKPLSLKLKELIGLA